MYVGGCICGSVNLASLSGLATPGLDNCATIVSSTDANVGLSHCSAMGSN
jgi:hypothetical protein